MSDRVRMRSRREALRLGLLAAAAALAAPGCGAEGEGSIKPPETKGNSRRLDRMKNLTKDAPAAR